MKNEGEQRKILERGFLNETQPCVGACIANFTSFQRIPLQNTSVILCKHISRHFPNCQESKLDTKSLWKFKDLSKFPGTLCCLLWLFSCKNTYWSQAEQEYTFHHTCYILKLKAQNSQKNLLFHNKILQKIKLKLIMPNQIGKETKTYYNLIFADCQMVTSS